MKVPARLMGFLRLAVKNVWLIVSAVMVLASVLTFHHFNTAERNVVVPMVGGEVYYRANDHITSTPEFFLSDTDVSTLLTVHAGSAPNRPFLLQVSDVSGSDCVSRNAKVSRIDQLAYSQTLPSIPLSSFTRTLYTFEVLPRKSETLLTCTLTTHPLHDTYVTRVIDFVPPGAMTVETGNAANRALYLRKTPEFVAFNIAGTVDVQDNGPDATSPMATLAQEKVVETDSFHIRARWTNTYAEEKRDFWTFIAAAVVGLALATLIEWARPFIDTDRLLKRLPFKDDKQPPN